MPKRIGIISQTWANPLAAGVKSAGSFEILSKSPSELAILLRHSELDAALLSPIDYAKDYAMYRILPGAAAVSQGESRFALLVFNENSRNISTLLIDPHSSSEIVLAAIVLAEKYDSRPQLKPFSGSLNDALATASAALVVGDAARNLSGHTNVIDLVDEWGDMTELPFVHAVWAAREGALSSAEVRAITAPPDPAGNGASEGFYYSLDEEASRGLTEFYRMAYYHGILKDIPDTKFVDLP